MMQPAVLVHDNLDASDLQQRWDALSGTAPAAGLFSSSPWCRCWAETVGKHTEPHVVEFRDDLDRTIGLLPLCLEVSRRGRWLLFMGRDRVSGDHLDLLCHAENAGRCLDPFFGHLDEWCTQADGIELGNLDGGSSLLPRCLDWAQDRGHGWLERERQLVPFADLPASFDAYLAMQSANMRYHVRRRRRALDRTPGATLEVIRDAAGLDGALGAFFRLHAQRWQRAGLTGNFGTADMQTFLRRFCRVAAERGWLRCHVLRFGDTPLGVLLAFHWGDTASFYQMGRDPDCPIQSPGVLLLAASIELAIREQCTRYDFLQGEEAYKSRWTSQAARQTTLMIAVSKAAKARLATLRMKTHVKHALQHCLGEEGLRRAREIMPRRTARRAIEQTEPSRDPAVRP